VYKLDKVAMASRVDKLRWNLIWVRKLLDLILVMHQIWLKLMPE